MIPDSLWRPNPFPPFIRPFSLPFSSSSTVCNHSTSKSGTLDSTTTDVDIPDTHAPAKPVQQQLSEQQRNELKTVLVSSFKRDPVAAAAILSKSLDKPSRRSLLSALEEKEPELSRAAMVADAAYASDHAPPEIVTQPATADAGAVPEPTFQQLLRVAITRGLPFVAFGFFDNIIMITAGEQIDTMFGAKLGLSSMAAAGLGNTVADVVGINISTTIESKFKSMKSMAPELSLAQLKLPQTRRAKWWGCAVGMAAGCLLGLTPLLFFENKEKDQQQGERAAAGSS